MIHPTRANLLLLKARAVSIGNSIGILRSRRQALIMELLASTKPYLESRRAIRLLYGEAREQLRLATGVEGEAAIKAFGATARREFGVEVTGKSIWGLPYKEIGVAGSAVRRLDQRGYDFRQTAPALEEGIERFEKIIDQVLEIARYDNKIQRLTIEVVKTTRRMRVLEERILPAVRLRIKQIAQYIGERERESHYRLKLFKKSRERGGGEQGAVTGDR